MKQVTFGASVIGASHKLSGMECQDSYKKKELIDGTIIMAVADGHGSKSCPFSKTGSKIAVNTFCMVMEEFYNRYKDNNEALIAYLNREGDTKVAQTIDYEWKRRVLKIHVKNKRDIPISENGKKINEKIYMQYGSTLVGITISPTFLFALQIGDGDLFYVNNNGVNHVLQAEKILGTETRSLSSTDSWKNAIATLRRRDNSENFPSAFLMSTDGFANSHKNANEFRLTCKDYFETIKQHGADAVKKNLKEWLLDTSEKGCGDDVTLLISYFYHDSQQAE